MVADFVAVDKDVVDYYFRIVVVDNTVVVEGRVVVDSTVVVVEGSTVVVGTETTDMGPTVVGIVDYYSSDFCLDYLPANLKPPEQLAVP